VALQRFGPAAPGESIVHGSAAPGGVGGGPGDLDPWIDAVAARGIERVVCLLSDRQCRRYHAPLDAYRRAFGIDRVSHVPMTDHALASSAELEAVLAAFRDAAAAEEPVVAHCLAGIGRTGQALAAWLVAERGFEPTEAVAIVRDGDRDPAEATRSGSASEADLLGTLRAIGRAPEG